MQPRGEFNYRHTRRHSTPRPLVFSSHFRVCPQVDAEPYVDMCVEAACSCPSVGDCACFCDVIAAYAQACSEQGVSISWRSNELCRECEEFLPFPVHIKNIILQLAVDLLTT